MRKIMHLNRKSLAVLPFLFSCSMMASAEKPSFTAPAAAGNQLQGFVEASRLKWLSISAELKERAFVVPAGRFQTPSSATEIPSDARYYIADSESRLYIGPFGFGRLNPYWHWFAVDLKTLEGTFIDGWNTPKCAELTPESFNGTRISLDGQSLSPAIKEDAVKMHGETFFFFRSTPSGKLKRIVVISPSCASDLRKLEPMAGIASGRELRLVFNNPAMIVSLVMKGPYGKYGQTWETMWNIGLAKSYPDLREALSGDFKQRLFCSVDPSYCQRKGSSTDGRAVGLLLLSAIALNTKEGSTARRLAACSAAYLVSDIVEDPTAASILSKATEEVLKGRQPTAPDLGKAALAAQLTRAVAREREDLAGLIETSGMATCLLE
jgi:hypothetical protein